MNTRWVAIAIGCLIVAIGAAFVTQLGDDPSATNQPSPLLGKDAPPFDLPLLDGEGAQVTLDSLAGKAVIINFWNSWCLPCRQEEPNLKAFYAAHEGESDFAMVGILREDTADAGRRYAASNNLTWLLVDDPDGRAALAYGTRGQPETYAISPDGVVVGSQLGPVTLDNLETLLDAARGGL